MCRSIKTLRGATPPPTAEDTRAAALQYVRKLSGYRVPSQANRAAFDAAVEDIAAVTDRLLASLVVPGRAAAPAAR
ncbi:MAG TPA: DUF2277 domain-containing protein [Candidatus Dormibacteraeota bacterium]|nr:DUF2277 domain-containing protein [Candidatus Dormibacteraeota bacterium]